MPLYRQFCVEENWDDKLQLRRILDDVWDVLRKPAEIRRLEGWLSKVEVLVPHAHDFDSALITAAQDCAICVDLALRYVLTAVLTAQSPPAVSPDYALEGVASAESARRTEVLSLGSTARDESDEAQVLGLPPIQNELACQRHDIAMLLSKPDVTDLVDEMRRSARANAHT
jgi:uncharacterized protein YjaG (DUF416 family)